MGQYFEVINVDRRESFHLGKLGAGLFFDTGIEGLLTRLPLPWNDEDIHWSVQKSMCIGPWAGHRIITAGDYMEECPAGMLTQSEEAELKDWFKRYGIEHGRYYSFACEMFGSPPRIDSEPPMDQNMVLRNLSKRLYVRMAEFTDYQCDKVREICSFDTLIKINTAWSADPSCNLAYDEDSSIIPGPWAGDRLDIMTLEGVHSGSWQDVTEQQAKRMVQILKAAGLGVKVDDESDTESSGVVTDDDSEVESSGVVTDDESETETH